MRIDPSTEQERSLRVGGAPRASVPFAAVLDQPTTTTTVWVRRSQGARREPCEADDDS
jgi:hypothetical protein